MKRVCSTTALLVLAAVLAAGCDDSTEATADVVADTTQDAVDAADTDAADGADAETDSGGPTISSDPDCDPLVPEVCAMPWPSSRFLAEDASTVTGYRLAFGPTTLPANVDGVHVSPDRYTRLDGYSIGGPMVVYFQDVDWEPLPNETEIADSVEADSPVVLLEVAADGSVQRLPVFTEPDLSEKHPEKRALFIRPAVILHEGTRYVVALRDLVRTDGSSIEASPAFAALRDGTSAGTPVADRQAHFDEVFGWLADAGVARDGLTLAWDFVTASDEALHGDMLAMRDDAFAKVEVDGIPMTIDSVEEYTVDENANIAFEVLGTFEVPSYMEPYDFLDQTGEIIHRGPDGKPTQNGTRQAEFRARVPRGALDGTPHGVLLHGHGLNGTHGQIRAGFYDQIAQDEHFIIVGVNMIGMSTEDVPNITLLIYELSHFPILSERLQQGLLEHLLIVRAMRDSFDQLTEIAAKGVVVDDQSLYYSGISQGGIFGGTIMALSQDMTRGHLGVPGNNYSTLLLRSVDFAPFFLGLTLSYEDSRDRAVLLSCIQGLWDSADPVSYYRHISEDPFPDTPAHSVLLASATGDHQVALLTNEIAARSDVGVALMPDYGKPVPLVEPATYPHVGSALVNYSFGNPWPPPGPKPPDDGMDDPHGKPRKLDWHNAQMIHFFRTGEVIDVCGGDGCTPD